MKELETIGERVMGEKIASDMPLMEAGLDSISAVELRNAVSAKFGVDLPATVTFDYPTLEALAGFISSRAARSGPSGQPAGMDEDLRGHRLQAETRRIAAELKRIAEGTHPDKLYSSPEHRS